MLTRPFEAFTSRGIPKSRVGKGVRTDRRRFRRLACLGPSFCPDSGFQGTLDRTKRNAENFFFALRRARIARSPMPRPVYEKSPRQAPAISEENPVDGKRKVVIFWGIVGTIGDFWCHRGRNKLTAPKLAVPAVSLGVSDLSNNAANRNL